MRAEADAVARGEEVVSLKIIRSTEAIKVERPKLLIYGVDGIGKSTLKNMTRGLLSQDFDEGEHRAPNRQDTVRPSTWDEVEELLENRAMLADYQTLGADTIGRCLDLLAADIITKNPKMGRGGSLTQNGWGELRTRFKGYKERLERSGKDIVWIAHQKEERDGDKRTVRPDIQGSSLGLVLQTADLVGYMHKDGKDRVISFEPTEQWHAKGPAGWGRIVVPSHTEKPHFLSELLDKARSELGRISNESAEVAGKVADWQAALEMIDTPEELTKLIPALAKLEPEILKVQVRELVKRKADGATWVYSKATGAYAVAEKVSA
jgi:hypothetical protein